jgi:FkbM family methyltransferase
MHSESKRSTYYDEDGCVEYLRKHFFQDHDYKGVMIDVGACEDVWLSVSKHFIVAGWTVLSVEPNPIYAKDLTENRPNVFEIAASDQDEDKMPFAIYDIGLHTKMASFSGLLVDGKPLHPWFPEYSRLYSKPKMVINVKVRTLNSIISDYNKNHPQMPVCHIDVVTVDVEGNELNVLKGLDLAKYQPKVILVEECDANDKRVHDYLSSRGYRHHGRLRHNVFYQRHEEPSKIINKTT